jgi:iron complex transport system substrate-binding protein
LLHRSLAAIVAAFAVLFLAGPAPSAAPQRIVSLSPTATESLFAIGAGSQVVAVDDQSDYPKSAPHTKLSGYTPNVEAISQYKPDLVIIAFDSGGVVDGLSKLGIRTLVQPAAKDLGGSYAQIQQLGAITGHKREATRLVASLKARIARVVAAAPKGRSLSVYHELTPDLYSATSKTFIGRIYALFGLRNIADAADSTASGFPQLSAEYIVAANPSVIVLADGRCCGQTAGTVSARPGWRNIAAVRDRAIVRVDDSVASRWGPRVIDFVRAVAAALTWVGR